jgi:hypothetical protein
MSARTKRRVLWLLAISFVAVLCLGVFATIIPYKERSNYICPITASMRTDVTWFGLFESRQRTVSHLELWLRQREPGFRPDWQYISTQKYYLGGGFSCGTAGTPEAYLLTYTLKLSGVQKMNDGQIGNLIEVLRHGSSDDRKRMIQSFSDEVMDKSEAAN